jgi:hypothetical protein
MKTLRFAAMTAMIVALTFGVAAPAQTAAETTSKPAANAWMLAPTPYLEWNKGISPALRAERDNYWDEVTQRELPLTVQPGGTFMGEDFSGSEPEIPDLPSRAILTATFTDSRSILSASERSIYTEVTMRVEEVFEDRTGSDHLVPHGDITIMFNGGTVSLRSGRILSDNAQPLDVFLRPGRRYLLLLSYNSQGNWYEYGDSWDISNGVVRANTHRTQYLAKAGRSSLSGLTVEQLGPALDKLLYRHTVIPTN